MDYKIFGCKVNKYYLNKRLNYFNQDSVDHENDFIVASCEVTDRAKSKWLKKVKSALDVAKKVYITGCGTLKRGELISDEEFYGMYPELIEYKNQIELLGEAPDLSLTPSSEERELQNIYTKKFVVIQNGCDNHCSFCLTVKKRGGHGSFPLESIISEIQQFEASGGKEIVLTGVNLAAWGCSSTQKFNESQFSFLLKSILDQTTIPRVRISSLGIEYLDDDFFEIIKDSRILPHFHLSVQSFSDKILSSMRRNYCSEDVKSVICKIRELRDNVSIGADFIVGFPGETEWDFQKTLVAVQELGINKLHVFPFSPHKRGVTVPAGDYEYQISQEIKKHRIQKLITTGDSIRNKFIQKNIGKKHYVLIEQRKHGKRYGRTENYIQVALKGEYKKGEIVEVVLSENMLI